MTRAYFFLCRVLGSVLRSARYSKARLGRREVQKQRRFYAPLLIWMGGPLMKILDTGVRVLPQQDWHERERRIYWSLGRPPVGIGDGMLLLPCLSGQTLASILDDPRRDESAQNRAIELAIVALAEFHRLGFTHGDAMAENVHVDLDGQVAHWFDFETVHDSNRRIEWRQADDVRALLATCLVRTTPERRAETVQLILDAYADDTVTGTLTASFASVWQRPLTFHLAQAPLSIQCFREIAHYVPRP